VTAGEVIYFFVVFFLLVVEADVLGAGFLAAGFLADTTLPLAGELPVTAFFAVPRLDAGVAFFAGTDFLPANAFFGAGALFALVTADFVAELFVAV